MCIGKLYLKSIDKFMEQYCCVPTSMCVELFGEAPVVYGQGNMEISCIHKSYLAPGREYVDFRLLGPAYRKLYVALKENATEVTFTQEDFPEIPGLPSFEGLLNKQKKAGAFNRNCRIRNVRLRLEQKHGDTDD